MSTLKAWGMFVAVILGLLALGVLKAMFPSEAVKQQRERDRAEGAMYSKMTEVFESLVETDPGSVANISNDSNIHHPRRLRPKAGSMTPQDIISKIGYAPATHYQQAALLDVYSWKAMEATLKASFDHSGLWQLAIDYGKHDHETIYRTSDGWSYEGPSDRIHGIHSSP